jgi:hypothetical protein
MQCSLSSVSAEVGELALLIIRDSRKFLVNLSLEAVALITTISQTIAMEGSCTIADRRLELIYAGASDFELRLYRLRSFARIHGWQIVSCLHGRVAFTKTADEYPGGR